MKKMVKDGKSSIDIIVFYFLNNLIWCLGGIILNTKVSKPVNSIAIIYQTDRSHSYSQIFSNYLGLDPLSENIYIS